MSAPDASYFPHRTPPTKEQISAGILAALDIQRRALTHDKRPFAAVLVGPDNTTVLLTHQSLDHVNHAESSLARLAATHYSQRYLWTCTLYSTWEPCAMCTATCYWAHIGRIVYAASEERLGTITGSGNEENFTMSLPCREVIQGSQKDIEIIGPVAEWEDEVVKESDEGYWKKVREDRTNAGLPV